MLRVKNIKISIHDNNENHIKDKLNRLLKTNILNYKIVKRSIDARDKNNMLFIYTLDVEVDKEDKVKLTDTIISTPDESYNIDITGKQALSYRPIIIGSGPSGLFAAYLLSLKGYKPIIFERGKDIDNRIKDVDNLINNNKLDTNSNIQFGEGGAGTFSDGKLNTLIKDANNRMKFVFDTFVSFGAPPEIIYDNHPHIGTDILRTVIKNMRNKIIELGGEFRFNSCLTDILIKDNKVKGVIINDKDKYPTDALFLCIGHSARDTFKMLYKNKLDMASKPFAVGIRIIHDQDLIDDNMYHDNKELLGHASYKVTYTTKEGRGVYSFCMCPGGYVINSSSDNNKLVINGMSNYKRDSGYANSALVVTVTKDDFGPNLFDGMHFQEKLEEKTYNYAKGLIPIQYYKDFIYNFKSDEIKTNAIMGKYISSNLNDILPSFITSSLKEAIPEFGKKIKGYDNNPILCGTETRTSSPIRIIRDENGTSNIKGIYPCGEGAGYAGGITSAAIDGLKEAEEFIKIYKPF
jgi:uncharacterized FAD-dependent dehydrogenase